MRGTRPVMKPKKKPHQKICQWDGCLKPAVGVYNVDMLTLRLHAHLCLGCGDKCDTIVKKINRTLKRSENKRYK